MSEADAGRIEESPSREVGEPVDAMPVNDRRSSSVEVVNGDMLLLHSIFYQGKTLKLAGTHTHIYNVVFRILKHVCKKVAQLTVAFPAGWDNDKPDSAKVASLCKIYNRVAKPFASAWSGSYNTDTLDDWGERNCTQKVAIDITTYAYELAVPRPADLNHYYKSFTSETYGETNLEQMASIIDELNIGPQDVLVDLGSGIGQLVCFTAAYAKCRKTVGIELSQTPANYANDLGDYFKKLMNHFGKTYGRFEHYQGDFLNPKFKKLICEEATVIFINNFAFSPELMFRITNELLQDLKHGTRIVTTKPFGDHKKELTVRSVGDINAISHTVELKSLDYGVSWTAKQVTFWLTTMDHTKLIRYYEEERRKKLEPSGSRERSQTEQATASQHSPKWNEPDTDYSPPTKKPKKEKKEHKNTADSSFSEKSHSGKDPEKKKKKKDASKDIPISSKPMKTPKKERDSHTGSKHSDTPTAHRSTISSTPHSVPSQPKPTAPPPSMTIPQQPAEKLVKSEEPELTETLHGADLAAKYHNALNTIKEVAASSSEAAAIQEAIESVLHQRTSPPQLTQAHNTMPYNPLQNAPAPAYQPAPTAPPQQLQQPNMVQPCSEIVPEQRHTFMIPPTDPLYDIIVSYYFEFKKYLNAAKNGESDLLNSLRQDIEAEKNRRIELNESAASTNCQIDELLSVGVHVLKRLLDQLGMMGVQDVSELLSGSKQIVTQHKALSTNVAQLEQAVAIEEEKLKTLGAPDALKYYNEAMNQNVETEKLLQLIIASRPANFVPQTVLDKYSSNDSKVSPSSRRARQPKPKQGSSGKRGNSSGRKSDVPAEDVDLEIQQFVQHAMKVDNAVKEKERKERQHRPGRPALSNPVQVPSTSK
ncbi:hypothetical protein L5515_000764 [Caenorhabditis briggsae]|uniref:Histone-lysine N-methyltransferase, H3 lysine-79 specific n=1 Tax=Caenorhabditis briggsae TaxID=6238 RepID=A0AAE9J2R8_CAEBR|nr:hypothetical protein L5515_000764 [Caenorhabditis briggsae]